MKKFWPTAILAWMLAFGIGCCASTIRYRNPNDPRPKTIKIKPEVGAKINQLDRIELYVGGIHVGTVLFDTEAGIFVGDTGPSSKVLQELLTLIEMLHSKAEPDGEPKDQFS